MIELRKNYTSRFLCEHCGLFLMKGMFSQWRMKYYCFNCWIVFFRVFRRKTDEVEVLMYDTG